MIDKPNEKPNLVQPGQGPGTGSFTRTTEVSVTPGRAVMCELREWHFIRDLVDALKDPVASAQSWVHSATTLAVSTLTATLGLIFGTENPNPYVVAFFIVTTIGAASVARFFQWIEKNIPSAKKDRVETIVDYMNRLEIEQFPTLPEP